MEKTGTRHLEKFGKELCEAYQYLAAFKWHKSFKCRREGCGHTNYYEGTTPYSRRCLKCKHDESVTAHTAFDRMRMPLNACIEIARMLYSNGGFLKASDTASALQNKGFVGIQKRSVARMIERISDLLKTPEVIYEDELLILSGGGEFGGVALLKGKLHGNIYYSYANVTELNYVVRIQTLKSAKVSFVFLKFTNDKPNLVVKSVQNRNLVLIDDAEVIREILEFKTFTGSSHLYCFKKNGNGFEDLMRILVT